MLFALKIALCRLERDCEPNASNSLRLVRKFWANKLIGAKPRRGQANRCKAAWKLYAAKPMDYCAA
jgi:hypothetical protein